MNLGQVLAMLAQGQDPQRYTAPQTQSSIPIPWQQIAAIPPADAEPVGFAKLPPVEVTASRLPALPEQMDPLSLYETELYGAPVTQQAPPDMLTQPTVGYGFAAPQPEPFMARMPPLPVRGARPTSIPEPQVPTEVMSQPPVGMADVQSTRGFAPEDFAAGQNIAYMEQPTAVEPSPAPVEEPKQPVAPWKPGQPFKVTTKEGDYTVAGYDPRSIGKGSIKITDPQGITSRVDPDVDTEFYNQIVQGYQAQAQASAPSPEVGDFTAKVRIGEGDSAQWYNAKVDPATNRIIYKTPTGRSLVYDKPSTLVPGENFIGGTTQDDSNLLSVQRAKSQILAPQIERIQKAAQDFPRTAEKVQLRSGLKWELVPNENPENPMPEVRFYYQASETDPRLTLDQAESMGVVSKGTNAELQARKQQVDGWLAQKAKGINEAIGVQAKSSFDRDLEQIEKQEEILKNEALSLNPQTDAARLKEIKKLQDDLQKKKDSLMTQSATARTAPGGALIVEGGTSEMKLPFNPDDFNGRLAMFSFKGIDQTGQAFGARQWQPDDYVNYIVDQALPNIQTSPRVTTPSYKAGIGALGQRLNDVQSKLYETLGDDADWAINDDSSVFQYWDENGQPVTDRMSLNQALTEFDQAQTAFRNNSSPQNEELFRAAARRLSGRMFIAGLGDEPITASPSESILSNISAGLQMPVSLDTRIPGTVVLPTSTTIEKAPALDISRPPAGPRPTVPPKPVPVFPINPTGAKNQFGGMEKWTRGYAPFTSLVSSPESWNFTAAVYEPSTTKNTAQTNMGYALLSDTGRLEPSEQKDVADVFDKVNEYISGPNGKPARDAIAASIRDNLIELGMTHLQSIGESTFLKALDDIYNAPDKATADARVKTFLNTYANRQDHGPKFVLTGPGQESIRAQGGLYHTNYSVPGAPNRETSHLFEQNLATLKDLAYLMRNSGMAYRVNGVNLTKHEVKQGTNVTWIANPLSRTYDEQAEYSVFTTPSATASPRAPIVVKSAQGTIASIPALNKGNNQLPTNGELDPAATYTMQNLTRVWGGNRWTRIADVFDAVDASMGNPLVKIAEKYHKPDMYNPSFGKRPQDDTLTALDSDSKKSIREMTAYNALMFSQFPPVRYRPFP